MDHLLIICLIKSSASIWVNTYSDLHPMVPFGGFGVSAIGRELGEEALREYIEIKSVRIRIDPTV